MGQPVTLKGQMHVCPMCDPGPRPHVGGPVKSTGQNFIKVNGVAVATVGDKCLCTGASPKTAAITSGSSVAKIGGKKIARMGDNTAHGGKLVQGEFWLTFD